MLKVEFKILTLTIYLIQDAQISLPLYPRTSLILLLLIGEIHNTNMHLDEHKLDYLTVI